MSVVITIMIKCNECCKVGMTGHDSGDSFAKTIKTMRADLARSGWRVLGNGEDICPACLSRRADARRLRQDFHSVYNDDDDIILGEMRDCGDK